MPDEVAFATEGELGRVMVERFLDAGGHAAWLTGDEVYGDDPKLREFAESPRLPRLGTLARVAGRRWSIEVNFQHAKTLVGLDQHQICTWTSWRRWPLLGMLALALLTTLSTAAADDPDDQPEDGLIALTRNETRHLISMLIVQPIHAIGHTMGWSNWRHQHQHQHQARTSHYQHRTAETA